MSILPEKKMCFMFTVSDIDRYTYKVLTGSVTKKPTIKKNLKN